MSVYSKVTYLLNTLFPIILNSYLVFRKCLSYSPLLTLLRNSFIHKYDRNLVGNNEGNLKLYHHNYDKIVCVWLLLNYANLDSKMPAGCYICVNHKTRHLNAVTEIHPLPLVHVVPWHHECLLDNVLHQIKYEIVSYSITKLFVNVFNHFKFHSLKYLMIILIVGTDDTRILTNSW